MDGARDRPFFAALAVLGAAALALSSTLEPTPDNYLPLQGYGRVRVDAAMHAVDYLIMALRIGGVVALVSGAYLIYRSFRPDRIRESEGIAGHSHDRYVDMVPEAGNPGGRGGIG
jgi:hypothetical protein